MDADVTTALDRLAAILTGQQLILSISRQIQELYMANEQEVRAEIARLKAAIVADQQADQEVVDALTKVRDDLTAKVAELQKQIDAGQPPTVDFDGILSDLQNLETLIVPAKDSTQPIDSTIPPGETEVPSGPGT